MKDNYWTIIDPANVPTTKLIEKAKKLFWNVNLYNKKDIDKQFPAPEKDITVSFLKSYEPDPEHLYKSYRDFISEKDKTYMNFRQYLILAMKVWEEEERHLSMIGWTITSSLWDDGTLLNAGYSPLFDVFYANSRFLGVKDPDFGPRECFFNLDNL
jgi:hypothetical protein